MKLLLRLPTWIRNYYYYYYHYHHHHHHHYHPHICFNICIESV